MNWHVPVAHNHENHESILLSKVFLFCWFGCRLCNADKNLKYFCWQFLPSALKQKR